MDFFLIRFRTTITKKRNGQFLIYFFEILNIFSGKIRKNDS